jgi:hypothetical protein
MIHLFSDLGSGFRGEIRMKIAKNNYRDTTAMKSGRIPKRYCARHVNDWRSMGFIETGLDASDQIDDRQA